VRGFGTAIALVDPGRIACPRASRGEWRRSTRAIDADAAAIGAPRRRKF